MTKILDFKKIITDEINEAGKAIKEGKLVIFPTETVYGIGANALDNKACENIFIAKGRASDNPLIVHISNINQIDNLVEEINPIEQRLIDCFMPGPFTLILKKKKIIPNIVSANLDTVGIRIPNSKDFKNIIKSIEGKVLATTSCNITGEKPVLNYNEAKEKFQNIVSIIKPIDDYENENIPSTVILCEKDSYKVLRQGLIKL